MQERIIYHVDVNSAFLSWEAARRVLEEVPGPDLREIPAVVGGSREQRHGIVLAKSIPAGRCRIRTGEPLVSAVQKCPLLTIVPPDYKLYTECSHRLMELLRRYSPHVEQYSIDEAFCDMTGMERMHGRPLDFADELREMIFRELGFTVNIGVSSNKLLAKMASEFKKPNRTHSLFPREIESRMWPLPVGDLFFVGGRTEARLRTLGILTIGDLACTDEELLVRHFKSFGRTLHLYANGIDDGSVAAPHPVNKGYGNSVTTPRDILTRDAACMTLLSLTETVAARIRHDGAYVSVVAVSIVDCDFGHVSHQRTLTSATDVTEVLYRQAVELFDELWNGQPIRQIGVHTSKAVHEGAYQYNLFDMDRYDRLSALGRAVDDIRGRFGEDAVQRACFIGSPVRHMGGGTSPIRRG